MTTILYVLAWLVVGGLTGVSMSFSWFKEDIKLSDLPHLCTFCLLGFIVPVIALVVMAAYYARVLTEKSRDVVVWRRPR